MDSLLATYASSDEEEDQPTQNQPIQPQPPSKFGGNLFSNLPPPSSSKPDKLYLQSDSPPSAARFSKLPQTKSERSDPFSVNPKPRKVVQFRPPVVSKVEDDDDDDDDNKVILKTTDDYVSQAPSVKSFLSSIPAPRNSGFLGAGAASSAGAGRRSILEAQVQGVSSSNVGEESADKSSDDDKVKYDHNVGAAVDNSFHEYATASVDNASYGGYDYSGYGGYQNVETDNSSYGPVAAASVDNSSYGGYEGYGEYGIHGQYESKWIDRSSGSLEPEIPLVQSHGKRGRNEIPAQVIEVNQDELMKNRPREDQVKLTGIAFGPSYQPVSSAKGKPSKLHKRKHQIGTLYFDMRSKEAELAERRSKGFLTKAQTQAKYGW